MSNRIEGVTEKLLESAAGEFLKHGYEKASMRVILRSWLTSGRLCDKEFDT